MVLVVEVNNKTVKFHQADDGWFVCAGENLAIDNTITICVTDPWHAHHICEPQNHPFRVVSIHK